VDVNKAPLISAFFLGIAGSGYFSLWTSPCRIVVC
jgi:hypothetical protein